jgi:probable FeS assembly SUF system protein SufT
MHNVSTVELTRDCPAIQIPNGTESVLPKGTTVDITQTLGGTYTVRNESGLFRINGQDADALGIQAPAPTDATIPATAAVPGEIDERLIWETLRTCFDPEIPVNIVDLGLVYDLNIQKLPNGQSCVQVKMTLTAQGCGMGGVIAGDAQQKILSLDGVEEASVEIVWDPPWHQSMITAQGRKILGLE